MNRATADRLKSLAGRSIARVEIVGESLVLAVPDSEGWRLVISPALDEQHTPTLVAQWQPGLSRPRRHRPRPLSRPNKQLTVK